MTISEPSNMEWFAALSADLQGDIMEMVNENDYPIDDIRDFIETYGAEAYADGHYVAWVQLTEELDADNEAIRAFVEEFNINALDEFKDAYQGKYGSESQFAEEYTSSVNLMNVPDFVVIDWQATWDNGLSDSFVYNNGHVFDSN